MPTVGLLACSMLTALSGCGYVFRTSVSPLVSKMGVRKVYLPPVVNNTYKAGIENTVYNDLVRAIESQGSLIVVQSVADADAVLDGSVIGSSYIMSAATSVAGLSPSSAAQSLIKLGQANGTNIGSFPIAMEYNATLVCGFYLHSIPRKEHKTQDGIVTPEVKPYAWSSSFTRTKTFPASNQLDVPGTTSALINDSEFERALGDLSRQMMIDVNESMLSMF